jgi:hypothetical protein
LNDIGLSRAELEAMHLGLDRAQFLARAHARATALPSGRALPVQARA